MKLEKLTCIYKYVEKEKECKDCDGKDYDCKDYYPNESAFLFFPERYKNEYK